MVSLDFFFFFPRVFFFFGLFFRELRVTMSKWIFLEIAISLRNYQLFGVHTCGETDFLNLLNKIIIPSFSYLNFTTNKIMLSKSGTRGCWSVSIKKKKKKPCPFKPQLKLNTWTYYSMMWVILISLFMVWDQMCEVYPYKAGKNKYICFLVVHLELVQTKPCVQNNLCDLVLQCR